MKKRQIDFKEFLTLGALDGVDIERDRDPARNVDL